MPPSPPDSAVRAAFDRFADGWQQRYAPGGDMGERVGRFVGALSERLDLDGARVLDLGCGTGEIARGVAGATAATVVGADISPGMLGRARVSAGAGRLAGLVRLGPDGALPFADGSFDAVLSSSVFEYLDEPAHSLREVRRVLRPGGWFVFTVPDERHPVRVSERRLHRLARIDAVWRLMRHTRWAGRFDYLHLSVNRWPAARWTALLAECGFRPEPAPACDHPLMLLAAGT